jgi:hypothetical protein
MRAPHPDLRHAIADERGTALIEFALILPMLLLILFAVVDFGKAFNYWTDETHMANQGARLVAVDGGTGGGALGPYLFSLDGMPPELQNGGTASVPSKASVCITYPVDAATGTSGQIGDPVTVTVNVTYDWLPFVASSRFGLGSPSIGLTGTATMRLEQVPTNFPAGCS